MRLFQLIRLYSTHTKSELHNTRLWLSNLNSKSIPKERFDVSFSRSSGPGGQNVNKVSSKATIKLSKEEWQEADWIPLPAREQLTLHTEPNRFPYTMKSGSLVVQSDRSRNRHDNVEDCYTKLAETIKEYVYIEGEINQEDLKKWENITKRAKEIRMDDKKKASLKKQTRKLSRSDDE